MKLLQSLNVLAGASAAIFMGAQFTPRTAQAGTFLSAAATSTTTPDSSTKRNAASSIASVTKSALEAFTGVVKPLSHPQALENAFRSYFAYKTSHPNEVRKPFLYFVDFGLPTTAPRGYLFDMESLKIVDGPFTVAQGSGSGSNNGVPTRFSNAPNSRATSLGLYVAKSIYDFHGHSSGQSYSSVGMRLMGVSSGFNDNALARGVVAHGAPYVTATKAGRSSGCPAMEPDRAQRLLPKLADGGMVFLFAPDANWMSSDPWLAMTAE